MVKAIENLTIISPPEGFEIVFSLSLILLLVLLSKLFHRVIQCDTMVDFILNGISVVIFMIILFVIFANLISYLFHGLAYMI